MQDSKERSSSDWWLDFYESSPFELFLSRKDPQETEATVDFLTRHLELLPGQLVFDQCCGNGEISVALAAKKLAVIGVDLCSKYIEMASARCAEFGESCQFYRGDAFQFKTDTPCDAAINWWTSFGYSKKTSENQEMLKRAFESLKPGGRLALDYPNIPAVLRNNKPVQEYEYDCDSENGVIKVCRESSLNLIEGLREQRWIFHMPDGKELVHDTSLKMYLPDAIVESLQLCGFVDVEVFGSVFGDPLELDSERCIFIARRPSA
ncbi:MAG: class I SAM-dependent methyltransferase [Cyanobacteriota/Melainabacteria group bacterium]